MINEAQRGGVILPYTKPVGQVTPTSPAALQPHVAQALADLTAQYPAQPINVYLTTAAVPEPITAPVEHAAGPVQESHHTVNIHLEGHPDPLYRLVVTVIASLAVLTVVIVFIATTMS